MLGVCLLFHRKQFEELVLRQLRERSPSARAGPVRYTKAGFFADAAGLLHIDRELATADELAQQHLERNFESFFPLKLADWESEHEYRFIEPSDDTDYSYVDIGDTLAAVMVGTDFPPWQMPSLLAACKAAGADVRKLSWDYNAPFLVPVSAF